MENGREEAAAIVIINGVSLTVKPETLRYTLGGITREGGKTLREIRFQVSENFEFKRVFGDL